jgi:hypothetical protein
MPGSGLPKIDLYGRTLAGVNSRDVVRVTRDSSR